MLTTKLRRCLVNAIDISFPPFDSLLQQVTLIIPLVVAIVDGVVIFGGFVLADKYCCALLRMDYVFMNDIISYFIDEFPENWWIWL